jgi:hypothetical protein
MVEYVAREMSRHRSRNRRRMLHLPCAICPDRSPPLNVTALRRDEAASSGHAARLAIRAGGHRGPTAGLAPGVVEGNLAILPAPLVSDFLRFCQLNPKPCPLIGTSAPGDPRVPELGEDLDIRIDLPRYGVCAERRPGGGIGGRTRLLARRSGEFRHRLLVFIRRSADGGGHRTASRRARLQRADVPRLDRHPGGKPVPWA